MTRADVVRVAKEYIGTPWHHCGRKKGVGIDCAGLLFCVFGELGAQLDDPLRYSMDDEFEMLFDVAAEHCNEIDFIDVQPGDILLFRNLTIPATVRMYNHCAIFHFDGEVPSMIHSWNGGSIGKTVSQPLDRFWLRSLHSVWTFRGLS